MHCSSSERLLDEYVDGTLTVANGARVAAHLATCAHCTSLLEELRVIDGLLIAPRALDPAPNFTFAVMAEVRAMPVPHPQHRLPVAAIATYIVCAWATIGAFLMFGGAHARAAFAALGTAIGGAARGFASLAVASGHVFGAHTFNVTAAMGALLSLDLLAAGAVVATVVIVRARRLAPQRTDS